MFIIILLITADALKALHRLGADDLRFKDMKCASQLQSCCPQSTSIYFQKVRNLTRKNVCIFRSKLKDNLILLVETHEQFTTVSDILHHTKPRKTLQYA